MTTTAMNKVDVDPGHWDRLFAPSSALAVITTVDGQGNRNAAPFGTCTRVCHNPVYVAFTVGVGKDTYRNVLETGQFVANLPAFDTDHLRAVVTMGADYPSTVDELALAGLDTIPSRTVAPERISAFNRHFECEVEWTREWGTRLMVCGKVTAASCDEGLIDTEGRIDWGRARPAHFCGFGYVDNDSHWFVSAYERASVPNPTVEA